MIRACEDSFEGTALTRLYLAVAAVLSNWHSVLRAINLASGKLINDLMDNCDILADTSSNGGQINDGRKDTIK